MTHYGMVIDTQKCIGCHVCATACKVENNLPNDIWWNRILTDNGGAEFDMVGGSYPDNLRLSFLPVSCQHCENPACVEVCPTEASFVAEDGTVQIDKSKCIGCQFCAMACPYGVRYLNEEERVVEKCTLCTQITAQGGLPQCVIQCGGRARFFGDLEQGIESFEAPSVGYDTDRSYDNLYTGNRVTLGDLAEEYADSDLYHLPNVGNEPAFAYILRNRDWKGDE